MRKKIRSRGNTEKRKEQQAEEKKIFKLKNILKIEELKRVLKM